MSASDIEILVEEPSMGLFLRILLPKILPDEYTLDSNCFIRPHEGKSHLQKSIPKKMKAYPGFPRSVKVLIIHDQDSNDCKALKKELLNLCLSPIRIPVVVRIACRELENWYLGDLNAVEKLYPESKAGRLKGKAKFRNPDAMHGSKEMEALTPNFTKTTAAREIVPLMDIYNNLSPSFQHFIKGLHKLAAL